jgi:predicted RNase H-like nuclease (RuvC/YqgF family)
VERLNTKGVPKAAVAIRKTEGADMPLTTYGLQALVARQRAEVEAIEWNYRLEAARGQMVAIEDLRATVTELERQLRDARDENTQLRAELERTTARRAMAVHGEGSQR